MLFWILIGVCIGSAIVAILIVIAVKFSYREDDDNLKQMKESIKPYNEQDNEPPTAPN